MDVYIMSTFGTYFEDFVKSNAAKTTQELAQDLIAIIFKSLPQVPM